MIQFLSSRRELTLRLAHAMMIRLLPVNNSAPPTTTRINPRLNAKPANSRAKPVGQIVVRVVGVSGVVEAKLPELSVVAKIAPSEINAPASTASANMFTHFRLALRTPSCSALAAMSAGNNASIWNSPAIAVLLLSADFATFLSYSHSQATGSGKRQCEL